MIGSSTTRKRVVELPMREEPQGSCESDERTDMRSHLMMHALVLAALLVTTGLVAAQGAPAADDRGWLGIYTEAVEELPVIPDDAWGKELLGRVVSGLRVTVVFPDSPAERGGLLDGDIIVAAGGRPLHCASDSARAVFSSRLDGKKAGTPFPILVVRDAVERSFEMSGSPRPIDDMDPERLFWREPQRVVDAMRPGEHLRASASTERVVKLLPVVLGLRPEAKWPPPRSNRDIERGKHYAVSEHTAAVWSLAGEFDVKRDTEDLLERLAQCHIGSDPYRFESMIYVHREPFRLHAVARDMVSRFSAANGAPDLLRVSTDVMVPLFERARALPDTAADSSSTVAVELLLDGIEAALQRAAGYHAMAFAAFSAEERAFLEEHRWDLSDAFAGDVYIHFDEDRERFGRNKRILDLAARVDYGALMECAETVAVFTTPEWAMEAAAFLEAAFADSLGAPVLAERATEYGRIIIAGTGDDWHRGTDVAFLFDLGGDDFYSGNSGANSGWTVPVSVLIDILGDDAYESTTNSCQGTGCLGVGGLLDLEGDDEYVGIQWAQGTAYLGVGWLHDVEGDDVYRGRTFCQGVG
ncbi:PDZ domain-containing protein, partial [bacterium]|nr:PDZ domain-containing protein [bacterium]